MPLRVTMEDVAKAAGVSKSAVSRALHNSPRISHQTRSRIARIAERLGYRPDPALATIAAHRWKNRSKTSGTTIAFLVQGFKVAPAYIQPLMDGAREECGRLGYGIDLIHFEEHPAPKAIEQILFHRGIQGVILSPVMTPDTPPVLDWARYSVVNCSAGINQPPALTVDINACDLMRSAWRKALESGRRRIGALFFDTGATAWEDNAQALAAFYLEQERHITASNKIPPMFVPFGVGKSKFRSTLKNWMHQYSPDIVLAPANGILPVLQGLGFSVPADAAFISLDYDTPPNPAVAGFSLCRRRLGAKSVQLLDLQIRNNIRGLPALPETFLLSPEWLPGASFPER